MTESWVRENENTRSAAAEDSCNSSTRLHAVAHCGSSFLWSFHQVNARCSPIYFLNNAQCLQATYFSINYASKIYLGLVEEDLDTKIYPLATGISYLDPSNNEEMTKTFRKMLCRSRKRRYGIKDAEFSLSDKGWRSWRWWGVSRRLRR